MKKKLTVIGVAALVIVCVAAWTLADGVGRCDFGKMHHARHLKMARLVHEGMERMHEIRSELDLTDEQCERIEQVIEENRAGMRAAVLSVIKARGSLMEAVLENGTDQSAIRAECDLLGDTVGDAAATFTGIAAQVRSELTQEQVDRLHGIMAESHDRLDEFLLELHE